MGRSHAGSGEIDTATPSALSLRAAQEPRSGEGSAAGAAACRSDSAETAKGPGVWVAKIVIDGQRIEERIGMPDSDRTLPGSLTFPSAVEAALGWGRQQAASVTAANEVVAARKIPTVRLAVETYVDMRKARADRSGSEGSLKLHVMSDQEFAGLKLAKLEAQNILDWRTGLPEELEPSSKNRILNDLRSRAERGGYQVPPAAAGANLVRDQDRDQSRIHYILPAAPASHG